MDHISIILVGLYCVILLYAVIVHEIAHGMVALWLGDPTARHAGRLTLHPRSHIDPIGSILVPIVLLFLSGFRFAFGWARPVPVDPRALRFGRWGNLLVSVAGPGVNLLCAAFAAVLAHAMPLAHETKYAILAGIGSGSWQEVGLAMQGSIAAIFFGLFVIVIFWHTLLGTFNLLPLPSLDGSKIFYVLFDISEETIMKIEQYGIFVALAFVLLFPGILNAIIGTMLGAFFSFTV